MGGHALDLQAGVAKELKQLTQRNRADVRRVAQDFPAVVIGRAVGMLAREDVFDKDHAAVTEDASHFAEGLQGILHVMERQAGNDEIELLRFEWEIQRIANAERNVGNAALLSTFARDREHGVGEVKAGYFASRMRKRFGDVARAGGDIENAF